VNASQRLKIAAIINSQGAYRKEPVKSSVAFVSGYDKETGRMIVTTGSGANVVVRAAQSKTAKAKQSVIVVGRKCAWL
jgi:hypothetical protein